MHLSIWWVSDHVSEQVNKQISKWSNYIAHKSKWMNELEAHKNDSFESIYCV